MSPKVLSATEQQYFSHFWHVADIEAFENVGLTQKQKKADGGTRYLTCADCLMGPVGFHDTETGESYVAVKRVRQMGDGPGLHLGFGK